MKAYTIARKTSEVYGHGDFGTELKIEKMGGRGSGEFPPIFFNQKEAIKFNQSVGGIVVPVDIRGEFDPNAKEESQEAPDLTRLFDSNIKCVSQSLLDSLNVSVN